MALVGPITINGSTGNSNWAFKTVVTETAIDTVKKTSTVKVENFLGRTNSTSYFMGTYTNSFEVAGQKFSETIYKSSGDIAAGKFVSLGSHTFTVTQTTTPLTITVKGSYSTSAFTPNGASSSGSVTLSKLHDYPLPDGDPTFEEQNTVLSNIGLDGKYFVTNLSIKKVTNPALTFDNAKIIKTELINGPNVYESSSSAPSVVTMDLTKNELYTRYEEDFGRNTVDLSIRLIDDMGGSFKYVYPYTWVVPYVKPNLITTSSNIKRNGQVSGKVNLNLTGTFYNDKIGSKSNTITLSYKYWKKGTTEPTTYITIPTSAYTISGNNFSIKNWNVANNGVVIEDVAKDSVYLFKIKADDSFGSTNEIELTCPKGEWLMAKFKNRIDFLAITRQGKQIYPNIYSFDETIIGIYNDKPLYRKMIDFGVLNNAKGIKQVSHNIENIDVITDVKITGYENDYAFSIPFVGTAYMFSSVDYTARVDKTNIYIYVSDDRSSQTAIATLEYTKTTDYE